MQRALLNACQARGAEAARRAEADGGVAGGMLAPRDADVQARFYCAYDEVERTYVKETLDRPIPREGCDNYDIQCALCITFTHFSFIFFVSLTCVALYVSNG